MLIFTAQIAFADSDLNVCTMMCELYKLVIQKTDQTAIDLGDKSAAYTVVSFFALSERESKQDGEDGREAKLYTLKL